MNHTFNNNSQIYVPDHDIELQQDLTISAIEKKRMKAKCTCTSPQQDALHGKGIRVFNFTAKGIRCTVCAVERVLVAKGK